MATILRNDDADIGALPVGDHVVDRVSRTNTACPSWSVKSFGGRPQRWPSQPPATHRSSSTAVPGVALKVVHDAAAVDGAPDVTAGLTRFQPVLSVSICGEAAAVPRYVHVAGAVSRMK